MTRVKICGITNLADAQAAVEAGADALGLVFAPSPRRIESDLARTIVAALRARIVFVGVSRDAPIEEVNRIADQVGLDGVQLHGEESPEYCAKVNRCAIKRFGIDESLRERLSSYRVFASLLDPGAGSGQTFSWQQAMDLPHRIIVAGGLTPQNVAKPVRLLCPFGVDVASGVELSPGRKDHVKLRDFIRAVREADAGRHA
jgi:phosphoribosylanthranilate isomerase